MKILVVGGSGLVGGQCMKVLSPEFEVAGTHISFETGDTFYFNPSELSSFSSLPHDNWDLIIHTGALTHVDRCETEPELSAWSTVLSTENLLSYAARIKASIVYISTDYVFDGSSGPYTEKDVTNPINIYGKHKLAAETAIINSGVPFLVFRVTNVYGDEVRGKNFVARTIADIASGRKEFAAPIDQFATPVNAEDIARCIKKAIDMKLSGIYHIGSTDYMSRVQVLQKIFEYFPAEGYKINSLTTAEMAQPAKRPLLGGLSSAKFIKDAGDFKFTNLDTYLKTKVNV